MKAKCPKCGYISHGKVEEGKLIVTKEKKERGKNA